MKFTNLLLILLMTTGTAHAQKYVGGDISCLPLNESKNAWYLDFNGERCPALELFQQQRLNTMRVRLFVTPADYTGSDKDPNACQDIEYVKSLGKRIKDAGFKLMLDFHYSDTWADPEKQWTPKAWENLSDNDLYTKIYDYTKDALAQMKEAGAEPDFIQTGNEISYGMLWGKASSLSLKKCYLGNDANWSRFTTLLKQAGKACREECPEAKIILHTERATETNVLTNFYDKMKNAGVDYDIIGLSYYPAWHKDIPTLEKAINTLESRYADKKIMIVEVGYAYSWALENAVYDYKWKYPITEDGQKAFTDDLITMLNKHESVNGLFWWWMEYNAYPYATTHMEGWWYAPLYDSKTGKPLLAMQSLKNFIVDSGIDNILSVPSSGSDTWYDINGIPVGPAPTRPGIYIRHGKKMIISR